MKLYLGKIDYNGNGRKNCKAFLSWELKKEISKTGEKNTFTAQGEVWDPRETDIYIGGQCLEEVRELCKNGGIWTEKAEKIFLFWKLYHLNDLKAGTIEQERIIRAAIGKSHDYTEAMKILKSVGMEIVTLTKDEAAANPFAPNPFAYGEAWLYRPIPSAILNQMEKLQE